MLLQTLGGGGQQGIAKLVAKGVVEFGETIDIQQNQAGLLTLWAGQRYHRIQDVHIIDQWLMEDGDNFGAGVDGIPIGFLICADAYKDEISSRHKQMGARILLSPANWPPAGEMGPKGYWEERSRETGLPLIVNNRTGVEPGIDFSAGESAAIARGKRLFTLVSPHPQLVLLDWDRANGTITPAGTIKLNE